jgi:hypothetical protein
MTKNFVVIFAAGISLNVEIRACFTSVHIPSGIILFIIVWRIDPLLIGDSVNSDSFWVTAL